MLEKILKKTIHNQLDSLSGWDEQKVKKFQQDLLSWYYDQRRRLPWREKPSLYGTVVSEFMLQQTRVSTRKSTGRGITAEGNTRKINEALATPDDADERAYFKALANAAKEGLDADHVYDISRIANAVRDMTPERRKQFFDNFKKAGIAVGNQEANIQAISKFLNQVVKPQETRELDAALKAMGKREVSLLEQVLNNEM